MKRERRNEDGSIFINSRKKIRLIVAVVLGSTDFLCAGSAISKPLVDSLLVEKEAKSFCDAYRNLGKLYKDPDNPYVQSFSLFGRTHWQFGSVNGSDAFGRDIDYKTADFRRFRLGAKASIFNHFGLKAQAELSNDDIPRGGTTRDVRFQQMWDMYVTFDAQAALGIQSLETLTFGYGARETHTSYEWHTSSNKLKTVERSALSNKIWPSNGEFANATGAWMKFGRSGWYTELGVFSTTQDDFWAPWSDGQMYWVNHQHDLTSVTGADVSTLFLTGYSQNSDSSNPFERLGGGIEWSTSAAFVYGQHPWQFLVEAVYGSNSEEVSESRQGNYWGFVFLPSIWIVEDKLEGVFRYQYQGSENPEGIRINSRYARRADSKFNDVDLLGGRGDEHHAFYLGLKYHFCKDNIHSLIGVEYDNIDRAGKDIYDGWSVLATFRTFL